MVLADMLMLLLADEVIDVNGLKDDAENNYCHFWRRQNPDLEHLGRLHGREGSLTLGSKGKIRWGKRKCPSDRGNNMNKGMETGMCTVTLEAWNRVAELEDRLHYTGAGRCVGEGVGQMG